MKVQVDNMKVTTIKNISNESIEIAVCHGIKVVLPPDASHDNIDVMNLSELGGKVSYVSNLTEVNNASGLQKLRD